MNQFMNPFNYMAKGFKIYKENFRNILIVCLIVYIPISIVSSMISGYVTRLDNAFDLVKILSDPSALMSFVNTKEYGLLMFYNIIMGMINLIFVPIGTIAIAKIASSVYYKHEYDFKDIVSISFSKIFTVGFATILYGLAITFGTVLFIIPGIFIAFSWYFYVYAIGIKDAKIRESFSISRFLVKGNFFRMLLAIAVISSTNLIIHSFIGYPFAIAGDNVFANVIYNFVGHLITAFFITSFSVFFCDVYDDKYNYSNTNSAQDFFQ